MILNIVGSTKLIRGFFHLLGTSRVKMSYQVKATSICLVIYTIENCIINKLTDISVGAPISYNGSKNLRY